MDRKDIPRINLCILWRKKKKISIVLVFSGFSKHMGKSDFASSHFRLPERVLTRFLTKIF